MLFSSWLRNRPATQTAAGRTPARFHPRLEALDDRLVPSTLTVTTALDPGFAGVGSLRNEIAAAKSGDTIVFDPSLNGQNITLYSQLVINKNLTIQGPGAGQLAISGYGETFYGPGCRVFEVDGATTTVTLSGLRIWNGGGTAVGGESYAAYDGDGGGILNFGTLTVSNCTLDTNSAREGGGIYNQGTLTVSGCTMGWGNNGNSATHEGGGIYNAYKAKATATGSTLSRNFADDGGGIFNAGMLSVSQCNLSGNSTTAGDGGGIWNGGTATVSGTTLSGNFATAISISSGYYLGGGLGGGIFNSGTLTLSGTTLSGNSAYEGGGIYTGSTLTLGGCYVDGNTAMDAGGGIFNAKGGHLTVQSKSTITGNSAPVGADLDNLGGVKISSDSTVGVISGK